MSRTPVITAFRDHLGTLALAAEDPPSKQVLGWPCLSKPIDPVRSSELSGPSSAAWAAWPTKP